MSDVSSRPRAFFDLFIDGQATASDADDFVTAWHESGDEENRPLTEYLGFTEAEYDLWTMDPDILPVIASARRPDGPGLLQLVCEHVRGMSDANDPRNRTALFSLGHWLQARGIAVS